MKHYGDITQIKGSEVPIVDIVTGGSPCQDLSVAGKRAGLDGARSGLFMEQIRIIKEMREHDRATKGATYNLRCVRPRYMVWENVPGAFSSNKGEDFRCVLEETARIADETAVIPEPMGGKWTPSGCIVGTGWSIAWRVHDAQFWGVPQRRKRIALVADFGGLTAPKILFERKSVSGDLEQSRETGQGTTATIEGNTDKAGTISFQERAGKSGGARESLYRENEQEHCQRLTTNTSCLNSWDVQSKHIQPENGKAEALYSGECRGGGGESYVLEVTAAEKATKETATKKSAMISYDAYQHHGWRESETLGTITRDSNVGVRGDTPLVCYGVDCYNQTQAEEVSKSLSSVATDSDHVPCVYGIDRASFNQSKNAQYDETIGALCARDYKGVGSQYVDEGKCIIQRFE